MEKESPRLKTRAAAQTGEMNRASDYEFQRNLKRRYPVAVRGEGVYLYDANGKKYLDACGGAAVVSIGHGVPEIIDAITQQARQLSYVHSSQFTSPVAEIGRASCRERV